jgi:GTP cyclohydrolase II
MEMAITCSTLMDPVGFGCQVSKPLVVRLHDESADSDIFNADASTCRPYLIHGIVECVRAAQAGGAGLIVYNRAEGNALGEVAKFLVHNARKVRASLDEP